MSFEAIGGLIDAVLDNLGSTPPDTWHAFAMVFETSDHKVTGTYGYLYLTDGRAVPAACQPAGVQDAVRAYMDSLYKPGEAWPVKFLFQFDRDLGNFSADFEDTDESRWEFNPADMGKLAEEIRPDFSEDSEPEVEVEEQPRSMWPWKRKRK